MSWANIVSLTDVNSLYIYEISNKKFFFFGDQHGSKSAGGCIGQCDDFNYNFTAGQYYGTSCTSIGILLHNWFTYNNHHNIKTDFYLELGFTKEQDRAASKKYIDIIKDLREQNGHQFDNISWGQLISYVMAQCFIRTKTACPYYPNVHGHYIDIRQLDTSIISIYTDPFLLYDIYEYLINNIPQTINDLINLKNDFIVILSIIIDDYKEILDGVLQSDSFDDFIEKYTDMSTLFSKEIGTLYINKFANMTKISVIRNGKRMHRVAAELLKLRQQTPYIARLIEEFIYIKAKEYITEIKPYFDNDVNILNTLDKFAYLDNPPKGFLIEGGLAFLKIFQKYVYMLVPLSALSMDTYLLARMFLETQSTEIIVYAGSNHIEHYAQFFEEYLRIFNKIAVPSITDNRCLYIPDLPKYLPANMYREYVRNKK